ncbi:4-hydroxy-tetrahydrodipicolinate synthase [Saliniradius amylolyticus]|uniref:4-hydroxy-tetrahydrodipicolinate synthase n=1 Tax=Saliniradius amylolyticus TaxID=2183582 RepID=A0A2S2E2I9_9ALTE|nr:4-hydroxy-tetrahydrodipicolinate synthase [Saliniradius amylolyticus]AWL11868.1 4-hydroxy-tetrahydrodipicolinate synthase [Saliniradius amylolyticus]
MFEGSIVALVTPMDTSGNVDYNALEELVEFHIDNGTQGIVAVGTTGESATLPTDEHIEVIKRTVEFAKGRIPIIAGTGANATAEAVELSQRAAEVGVDGQLTVVPYYNKPQQSGILAHFQAVAEATDLPTILYNVPGRTVADMADWVVEELAQHPNIVGLKDATGDLSRLASLKPKVPEDFVLLSGEDPTAYEFLKQGGHGVISVTANIVPAEMARLCQLCGQGKLAEAEQLNESIADLHELLFIEPNPVMPKWALFKMQRIASATLRLPLVEPELNSQERLEKAMQQSGLI